MEKGTKKMQRLKRWKENDSCRKRMTPEVSDDEESKDVPSVYVYSAKYGHKKRLSSICDEI